MNNLRVYLSGPMTGIPDLNAKAFNTAEAALRHAGYEVVNPIKLHPPGRVWPECVRVDLREMLGCQVVGTLGDWDRSRGASLEVFVACQVGIRVASVVELVQAAMSEAA